ncbi:Uma2 family endonuclease [Tautonia plasticadhaerens]|uniref:Putative restriction endonuclease domain-containing protein n=1 Tax=Tautonia plasticadhaerens TaxID=2527974 RepID=A0A518HBN9_9BACT|nr:Uma2 family endonuclease [Tautonia plasticadhaerens]QDV38260.1 hypothetical protein ElP_62110 [Tautonia plasticadhaerens]
MSTQTAQPPGPRATVRPYRLTVRQFLKAVEAGVFPHDVRLELLGGIPVRKMTTYPPHNSTVYRLASALRALVPPEWIIFEEKPIVAGRRWRPMPDISIVRGPIDRLIHDDPRAEGVAIVIEVSDSTYADDRGLKWRRYAASRLASYWIVDLKAGHVEAHSDPTGRGDSARYRATSNFKKGESVPVIIGGVEVGRVAVNDFMP